MNRIFFCLAILLGLATAEYPAMGSPAFMNDNSVLQYALSLELLEYNFYMEGLMTFNATDFKNAGYSSEVYQFLEIIMTHEMAHSTVLQGLLSARGATPVSACNYTFPYDTVVEFLQIAAILEQTGVSAYDGAINSLTQTDLIVLAASVASVEGRHAAYLNLLTGMMPYMLNATDTPLDKATVGAAAMKFINGTCMGFLQVANSTLYNATQLRPSSITNDTLLSLAYENDNNILRFALTLERTEVAFFTGALANITQATLNNATAAVNFSGDVGVVGNAQNIYYLYSIIRDHEVAHAAALTAFLTARNASIPAPCTNYLFSFNNSLASARQFIMQSYMLELGGLEAFIGSSQLVTDPAIALAAATIITVEAKHVSFERALMEKLSGDNNTYVPFPNITDTAGTPQMVLSMVSAFVDLSSCPTLVLPVPADSFRSNYTTSASDSNSGSVTGTDNTNTGSRFSSSSGNIIGSNTQGLGSSATSVAVSLFLVVMLALLF